jgi:hypothetical protein
MSGATLAPDDSRMLSASTGTQIVGWPPPHQSPPSPSRPSASRRKRISSGWSRCHRLRREAAGAGRGRHQGAQCLPSLISRRRSSRDRRLPLRSPGLRRVRLPWGIPRTPLADESGPEEWQRDVLIKLGNGLLARRRRCAGAHLRLSRRQARLGRGTEIRGRASETEEVDRVIPRVAVCLP